MNQMGMALVVVGFTVVSAWSMQRAAPPTQIAYVHASRASLRSGPSPDSTVIAQFTTNTELRIERREADSCVVTVGRQRGFMTCRMLGKSPLTEAEALRSLGRHTLPAAERLEWAFRAFWINPSLSRFVDAGTILQEVKSSDAMWKTPQRPRHAEFEALKSRLRQGVIAGQSDLGSYSEPSGHPQDPLAAVKSMATLLPARPSHFTGPNAPFVIPLRQFGLRDLLYAAPRLADALSGTNRARMRIDVLTGPIHDPRNEDFKGIWDVGTLGVTFDQAAVLHGVTADGRSSTIRVQSMRVIAQDWLCPRSPLELQTQVVRGPWDRTIVAWVGQPPGTTSRAQVRRFDGPAATDKLVIEDIDVNSDAIPDLSIWSGRFRFILEEDAEGFWTAVFVNVRGAWQLAAYDQLDECT
jgi:hypothetical protein